MNNAAILHKKPGFLIPDLMLKKASVACPTAFGFAGREKDELKSEMLPKMIPLGELQELQTAFKDEDLVLFFANFPKAVLPDDVQPWMMNDSNGNPLLAIFCEGDFKDYEGLNGDHTGEYCASEEIIFPRLLKAGEVSGDDVQKMIIELNKPGLKKVLTGTFQDRGVYLILPRVGEPICFGDNKLGGEFTWGRASNTFGYKEETTTTEKAAEVVKSGLTFLRGRSTSAEATPAAAPVVEVPEPAVIPALQPASTPSVPAVPAPVVPKENWEAKGYKRMFPPSKMGKGKARNMWLRTFNCVPSSSGQFGVLPPDHESSTCSVWVQPELIELAQRVTTSKSDVDNLATSVHKFRTKGEAIISASHVVGKSSAEVNAAETAELARQELLRKSEGGEKPITRSGTREKYVPTGAKDVSVMSDANKELAMVRLGGYLATGRPRPSPLELQKNESKHANFSQSTSTTFEERLFLPKEQILDLFDGNEIATAMYTELKWRYIQDSGIKLEDLITPKSYPEQQPEVIPPQEEVVPEPKKSGALSFLRGKAA